MQRPPQAVFATKSLHTLLTVTGPDQSHLPDNLPRKGDIGVYFTARSIKKKGRGHRILEKPPRNKARARGQNTELVLCLDNGLDPEGHHNSNGQ